MLVVMKMCFFACWNYYQSPPSSSRDFDIEGPARSGICRWDYLEFRWIKNTSKKELAKNQDVNILWNIWYLAQGTATPQMQLRWVVIVGIPPVLRMSSSQGDFFGKFELQIILILFLATTSFGLPLSLMGQFKTEDLSWHTQRQRWTFEFPIISKKQHKSMMWRYAVATEGSWGTWLGW